MQTRPRAIIAGGVVVAVVGAIMVFAYGRSVEGKAAPAEGVRALVATADIAAGTRWEDAAGSVEEREVPAYARPSGAVEGIDELRGRTSVRAVSSGEVVTGAQFGQTDTVPAGGLEIPPGHNAISVDVGVPQGVARYPQPGDLVNVYTSFQGDPNSDMDTITKLMLSNVQVLSVRVAGTEGEQTGVSGVLLTLALTPDAAERVIFAKERGSLWFGLVSPGDGQASTGGRTFSSVLG